HLAGRPYLFGGRPALGDFGLFAQLQQCATDPAPGAIMRQEAPATLAWTERMLAPQASGEFERWEELEPTLLPLLRDEVGTVFFPWSLANAQAIASGARQFSCTLDGRAFTQEAQKYHAKSLGWLRDRYARVAARSRLDPILERAGCPAALRLERDPLPAFTECDRGLREERRRGEHGHQPRPERQAVPAREDEPRRVVDDDVERDPRGEGVP